MPTVYIDHNGDVRSCGSDRIVAPAGTTPREARVIAALWTAAADALQNRATAARPTARGAVCRPAAAPIPITAAPSYVPTAREARRVLAVIDIEQLAEETARDLAALAQEDQ